MLSLTVKNHCFFFLKEGRSCLFPSSLIEGGQIIEQMNVSLGLGSVLPTELFLWFQFVRQNLKLRSCTRDPTLQAACCLKVLPLPLQCIKHKLQYFSSFVFAWYYTLGNSAGCWLLACILPEYVSLAQVALTVQRGRFLSKKKGVQDIYEVAAFKSFVETIETSSDIWENILDPFGTARHTDH